MELDAKTTYFQQRKKTKLVRFNEQLNQSYRNEQIVAEECHRTWYSGEDYNAMRAETRASIERLRRMDKKNKGNKLSDILGGMLDLVCSVRYVVEDAKLILTDEKEKLFNHLYASDENCIDLIGLEVYLQSRLRREYKVRRECIQDVVHDIQNEYAEGILTKYDVDQELQDSCLNFTQAMVLMAQLQAQAQFFINTSQ